MIKMQLIDPKRLDGCRLCTTDQFPRDRRVEGWNDCIEYLQKCCTHVPTVEVVQCRDCKYREVFFNDPTQMFCHQWLRTMQTDLNFFCAHGAKMDAEVEG